MLPLLAPVALLAASALAQEATGFPATLEITSPKSDVTVARIEGHVGSSGGLAAAGIPGGSAAVWSTAHQDLCVTPCRVELPPGPHELSFYGKGYRAATETLDLRPGETRILAIQPASFGVATLSLLGATAGIVSVVTGGLFLALDVDEKPADQHLGLATDSALLGTGAVLTGVGFWGMRRTRTVVAAVTPSGPTVAYNREF